MDGEERPGGQPLVLATCIAAGSFLGAIVGATIAVVQSCEPDYPILCELGGLVGGVLGLAIGAALSGFAAGMALHGTLRKPLGVAAIVILVAIAALLFELRVTYPRALDNVLVDNRRFWVSGSLVIALIVGAIAFAVERHRRPSASTGRHVPV